MHSSCGVCEQCREGKGNLCRKFVITGVMVDGGYAQFMRAKAGHAIPVPESLTSVEAAPLFCAGVTVYRALKNASVAAGQRVAVVGVGGLGHLAIQVARAFGAEAIALDVAEDKLTLARALGASSAMNATDPQAIKSVRQLGGVHVAVMASAAKAAFDTCLKCLRPGGTLSVVGLPAEPFSLSAFALVSGEFRVMGSAVGTRDDLHEILRLGAAGKVRCHTETKPMDEVNEVLRQMRNGTIAGRIVLTMR
jgi:propanol-preferring alcohol dehydrogenase